MELTVLDAVESGEKTAGSERLEPLAPALIPGWHCLPQAIIRAGGEEGFVDLAALHPDHGVALIAFLDAGEEASPDEACAAFRAMLAEVGFAQRFPGELPVVAWAEPRAAAEHLAAAVERRFATLPGASVGENWVDWVAERLARSPQPEAPARPRLVAPLRDELPPAAAAAALVAPARDEELPPVAGEAALAAPDDRPPAPLSPHRRGWSARGTSLGFAFGLVVALVVGAALLLHP